MSNESRLRRDGAISYLQKSNLENLDILLQAIDHALLLPRDDEFSEVAFLPNTPKQAEVCELSPSNGFHAESSASRKG
jgi:hypothetical protein